MKLLIACVFALAAASSISAVCMDKRSNCKYLKTYCNNPAYKTFMKTWCSKTCNLCSGGVCMDKRSDCKYLKTYCNNPAHKTFMKTWCSKTCNLCSGGGITKRPPTQRPATQPPPVSQKPGSCGNPAIQKSRVIAGTKANKGSWPWQVLMMYNGRAMCGGSLISPNWIVTAAHCVSGKERNARSFTIRLGEHNRNSPEGSEEDIQVERIITHHSWDRGSLNNDIAMMKLSRPPQMNRYVSTVCLPSGDVPVGTQCYITGWGKIRHPGQMTAILQQGQMPVVSNNVCHALNRKTIPISITAGMICSGHGGSTRTSGCHGDSGGPFVCNVRGRWELHGAVSHGSNDCSAQKTYTVYARVNYFKSWIERNKNEY